MLRMAIPLAFAELGWMSMSVVDNIMVGRLPDSAAAIGAASIGSAFFYVFAIFGIGLMSGLDTLVSQAYGAGDLPAARRSLISGLMLAGCATPVLAGCILGTEPLLSVIGITPRVRDQAIGFNRMLVWSLPLLLLYTTFRRYLQGIHYVRPVTFALVSSNLINVVGNWILIYGHWGAPPMGIRGSALSTVMARIYLAGVLLAAIGLRDPGAWRGGRPGFAHMKELLRLGFPAALTIAFEVGVFHTATALVGKLDPVSLAAHTIAMNASAVTYMVPLGIGSAAAVSVGRALGAKNRGQAIRAGWVALGISVVYEIGSALAFVFLPRQIARVYTTDRRIISFAVNLFRVAAVFQIFDGLQTVASGALRGLGNTRTPMVWNLVCYWVIGLPIGYWLCFVKDLGVVGLWDGLCLALILIGAGLVRVWAHST